jgi:hypothetical protein
MNVCLHIKFPYSCQIWIIIEFSRQIFKIISSFHENPASGSRVVPCGRMDGRTDMTKQIVAFHNFTNAHKNGNCLNYDSAEWIYFAVDAARSCCDVMAALLCDPVRSPFISRVQYGNLIPKTTTWFITRNLQLHAELEEPSSFKTRYSGTT